MTMPSPAGGPVLICLSGLARGGLESHVLTLARALRHRGGCSFRLACHFDAWFMRSAQREGLPVDRIPLRNRFDPRARREFQQFVRDGGFTLIHAHDKRILLSARPAARRLRLPLVTTCHGWVAVTLRERFTNWLDLRLRLPAERFIAVSPAIKERLGRAGVRESRLSVIPNSVDLSALASLPPRERVRAAEGIAEGDFLVGSVGRLAPEKRPDLLLRVFARFRSECQAARLLVVGDGPERGVAESLARSLGIAEAVRFTGFRDDAVSLLNALDAFLLTSQTEGTPQALIEAMALAVPIVATRVGGVPALVDNEREALLAPPGDVETLACHLAALWRDPPLGSRLGGEAQRRARAEFSADRMAEQTERVYQAAWREARDEERDA